MLRFAANSLWYLSCLPEASAFRRSLGRVAETQEKLLLSLLRSNRDSAFGRKHGFGRMHSAADYRRSVPLSGYDDYESAVEEIASGAQGVLTGGRVMLLEPTSGTTSGRKLIPYTAALKAEFRRGLAPWMADLYRATPGLLSGQAYWSVTPAARQNERTPGGIPVGFDDDSGYLGVVARLLQGSLQAVPSLVREIGDMEAFFHVTLLFLLKSRSLALISVWNPTYLAILTEKLHARWRDLVRDIREGVIRPPGLLSPSIATRLARLNPADGKRADEIEKAFSPGNSRGVIHSLLWPRLRLVSCWADAAAEGPAAALAALFPAARIQGKGLLATEGFVSLPLTGHEDALLSIRSHYFEFIPEKGGEPLQAHELEQGSRYSVVISTGGGLYRYMLRDRVEVTGHLLQCPRLRFLGKEDGISDRYGEKLHESHARNALDRSLESLPVGAAFAMLACEDFAGRGAYTLFIQAEPAADGLLVRIGKELEIALRENYHYDYCRDLGQLGQLRVFRIDGGGRETYLDRCYRNGQRLGDIKPTALHRLGGWSTEFRGRFVDSPGENNGG